MTLEHYLDTCSINGHFEHVLRITGTSQEDGTDIYIHPNGPDGPLVRRNGGQR